MAGMVRTKTEVLPANFVRAYLEIEGGAKLECYFNPTEYSIAKTNSWKAEEVNGKSTPNQKFTSGEPLRADVKLSLVQTGVPTPGQNPTTRATSGFGQHTVKDGDTLPSISYGAYGDATKWRLIAEANGVDNPLHLRRGRRLSLPVLEG
jgi:nucleoid-associated protein YgaU